MVDLFDQVLSVEVNCLMLLFVSFLLVDFMFDLVCIVDIGGVVVLIFFVGGQLFDFDYLIFDQFLKKSGVIVMIFVCDGDDFVCIMMLLKKQDGVCVVGMKFDCVGFVYVLFVVGCSYMGFVKLFGWLYIMQYKLVIDVGGCVIGVLFVGFDIGVEFKFVEDGICVLKIGDNGYYFVFDVL